MLPTYLFIITTFFVRKSLAFSKEENVVNIGKSSIFWLHIKIFY